MVWLAVGDLLMTCSIGRLLHSPADHVSASPNANRTCRDRPPTRAGVYRLGVMVTSTRSITATVAASEVAGLFDLDEVVVPTGQPALARSDRRGSAAEDRYRRQ